MFIFNTLFSHLIEKSIANYVLGQELYYSERAIALLLPNLFNETHINYLSSRVKNFWLLHSEVMEELI